MELKGDADSSRAPAKTSNVVESLGKLSPGLRDAGDSGNKSNDGISHIENFFSATSTDLFQEKT